MKRLLRKIVTFIDNQALYPRGHVFLDKVVLAHVSKALNVAQSIMTRRRRSGKGADVPCNPVVA
jgi:hypothetical protein